MNELLIHRVLMAYQRTIDICPQLSDPLSKDIATLEYLEKRDPPYDASDLSRLDNERALLRELRTIKPYLTSGHGLLSSIVAQKLEDLPLGAVIERKKLSPEKILKDIDEVNNLIASILGLLKDSFAVLLFDDPEILKKGRDRFHILQLWNLFFSHRLEAIQVEEEILRKEEEILR